MLLRPIVTEKTSKLSQGQYVFAVSKKENKIEIAKEVASLYKVKVKKVRIINTSSKVRRLGRIEGVKPGIKKAVVILEKGQKITTF